MAGVRRNPTREIAAEDVGTEDGIAFEGDAWKQIVRGRHEIELLDPWETDGVTAVTGWLDARELGWTPARKPPARDGLGHFGWCARRGLCWCAGVREGWWWGN
ncbi:hypothetical protein [Actinomycetospora flava]|uniref:Uncharacterized protein n=1 Tax=Actinomycetospora flava TaxID=3129232 RepID=A0ABU8MDI3_9PSEU